MTDKSMQWVDAMKTINTKGIIGPRINLTKRRARILKFKVINDAIEMVSVHYPDDNESSDQYIAACQWVLQQIQRRWSQNELQMENKKRKKL